MKRTREKTEQQDEEEVRSQLFDSEVQNPKKIGRQIFIIAFLLIRSPLPCALVEAELSVSPRMFLWRTSSLDVLLLKVLVINW